MSRDIYIEKQRLAMRLEEEGGSVGDLLRNQLTFCLRTIQAGFSCTPLFQILTEYRLKERMPVKITQYNIKEEVIKNNFFAS